MGKLSVGATFQLGGKFGVGYSGGTRKAILISLTSPSSLALPHMALPRFERVGPVNASYGPGITFTQIAPVDLDIAIVRQLPSSQLPLHRQLETGSLEVKGFEAPLGCRRLIDQSLKDAPMDAHGALVLAKHNGELDRSPLVIPTSVLGEG